MGELILIQVFVVNRHRRHRLDPRGAPWSARSSSAIVDTMGRAFLKPFLGTVILAAAAGVCRAGARPRC